jgi:CheY-like chemotaxis protein
MAPNKKRILVVAHNSGIRLTRTLLLEQAGYSVVSVEFDDEAMNLLENETFDLVLLGRNSRIEELRLDQRLREKYPKLLTLKIQGDGELVSLYPSRITDTVPQHVVEALNDMLR